MRSLFLRIFLSYWVATALFLVLAIVVTLAMRPSGEISSLQAQQARFLNEAVQAFQIGGVEGARKYLRTARDVQHSRLYLFDEHGQDILGRNPPDWIMKVERGEIRTADTFLGRLKPARFLRSSTTTADGHSYTLVTELPPEPHAVFGPHGIPGLALLIGIISSGLVCYILARYLTAPVVRLRVATQKLASGDLSARAGVPHSRRHDEIAAAGIQQIVVLHSAAEDMVPHQGQLPFAAVADPGRKLYGEFGVTASARAVLHPKAWTSPLNPRVYPIILRGIRAGGSPAPRHGDTALGLPADFLIEPDGRLRAAKYGRHASDHWSVDELLQLARAPAASHSAPRNA